jgi:hypothetical protein
MNVDKRQYIDHDTLDIEERVIVAVNYLPKDIDPRFEGLGIENYSSKYNEYFCWGRHYQTKVDKELQELGIPGNKYGFVPKKIPRIIQCLEYYGVPRFKEELTNDDVDALMKHIAYQWNFNGFEEHMCSSAERAFSDDLESRDEYVYNKLSQMVYEDYITTIEAGYLEAKSLQLGMEYSIFPFYKHRKWLFPWAADLLTDFRLNGFPSWYIGSVLSYYRKPISEDEKYHYRPVYTAFLFGDIERKYEKLLVDIAKYHGIDEYIAKVRYIDQNETLTYHRHHTRLKLEKLRKESRQADEELKDLLQKCTNATEVSVQSKPNNDDITMKEFLLDTVMFWRSLLKLAKRYFAKNKEK